MFLSHPGGCAGCSSYARDLLELGDSLDRWDGDLWLVTTVDSPPSMVTRRRMPATCDGRIGGTVARAFARDGAHVFLAGARATRWTPSPGTSGRPAELFAAFGLPATA